MIGTSAVVSRNGEPTERSGEHRFVEVGVPRRSEPVASRQRLFQKFRPWTPLTLIRGPLGYGKTTLLLDWLHQHQSGALSVLWITATAEMNDPSVFLRELADGFRRVVEPHEILDDAELFAFMDQRAQRASASRRWLLVVDEFHHITDPDLLTRMISTLQRHRSLFLIAASVGIHRIEALAAGAMRTTIVTDADLLFTNQEIRDLATLLDRPLSEAQAELLHEETGGWPAPVSIALERGTPGDPALAAAAEYIERTVLPLLKDQPVLTALMKLTQMQGLDLPQAHHIAGKDNIQRLEQMGLLSKSYRGERTELRVPALINTVLGRFYRLLYPEDAAAFHADIARWFFQRENDESIGQAFSHAVMGQAWDIVDNIWQTHGTMLVMKYDALTLAALKTIPELILRDRPDMRARKVLLEALTGGDDADGRMAALSVYVQESTTALAGPTDHYDLADLLHLAAGYGIGLRMAGEVDDAATFTEGFYAGLGQRLAASVDPPHDRLGWFHLQWGLTLTLAGRDREAISHYQFAWGYGSRTRVHQVPANAAANLAMTHALSGDPALTRLWLDRQQSRDTSGQWVHYLTTIGSVVAVGMLALDRLDEDTVRRQIRMVGDGRVTVELWPYVIYLSAQYARFYQDPALGLASLNSAQASHLPALQTAGAASTLLLQCRIDLLLAGGQVEKAQDAIDRAAADSIVDDAQMSVSRAKVHLASGEDALVVAVVERALWHHTISVRDRLSLMVLGAAASSHLGNSRVATELTAGALELGNQAHNLCVWATIPTPDRTALMSLVEHPLEQEVLTDLAGLRSPFAVAPPTIRLTRQQHRLLVELSRHATRQDMADALFLSRNTIKTHLAALYAKLGTKNRADTLAKAEAEGLIKPTHRPHLRPGKASAPSGSTRPSDDPLGR